MRKLLIILSTVITVFVAVNFVLGTQAIQKLQQERPSSFICVFHYENICLKNFGFDAWLSFSFIPLLAVISTYFSLKVKINPLFSGILSIFSWILILELLTQVLHIPALYHSLERSSLHYSVFFVQLPLAIYPGGMILSDQMMGLAIILLISLFISYMCNIIFTRISKQSVSL